MKLKEYKQIFIGIGLIGILLIASLFLANIIHLPDNNQFSELYLLGADHTYGNYPYNIAINQKYSIFPAVQNHMSSSMYFVLYLKFSNGTNELPNNNAKTPSILDPLYEYRFIIPKGENWEGPLTFSFGNVTFSGNHCFVQTMVINGITFEVNKSTVFDINARTFNYQLLLELWAYKSPSNLIYDDRFVFLQLNFTKGI
jgi:hypothetical protein